MNISFIDEILILVGVIFVIYLYYKLFQTLDDVINEDERGFNI